jgi:hypothetical protein
MARYLIRRDYIVEAKSRIEARQIFTQAFAHGKEEEFLVNIKILETDQQANTSGWRSSLREQLFGSSHYKR